MFKRGHMKPLGSHKPPDYYADVLEYMISPEDFYMNYVVAHKPVVIKGYAKTWPAYHLWTDEYLKEKYGNTTMHMETKDDDKENIPPSKNFGAFIDSYRDEKSTLYMVDEVLPEMREEIVLPLCLRCEEIDRSFFVSYFWLSGGNTHSTAHIDTDENLLCVLNGHKRAVMVSPIYSSNLYADESKVKGVSNINTSAVDLEKYPEVMKMEYWVAEADEGDCMYIPQMWWHQVHSRKERQMAVALWWKSKPFWKNVKDEEKRASRKFTEEERKTKRQYSYSDALKEYEEWVLEVAPKVPRIKCREQQVLMSKYHWETDKIKDAAMTLGDGGDIEEDEAEEQNDIDQITKSVEKRKEMGEASCAFDKKNKKSPCHFRKCEDEDDLVCVKYILEYCGQYEDRGCVVNKPQLLNKRGQEEMVQMSSSKPIFKS
eukprot:Seg2224.2 transcript_id=Seg2224.2/GoldUCD/mRNA.D3Y31 product="Lysine-specific demethylase 8" protein_id=Seg2224.2/GoldUCD/D3Y31